MKKLINADIIKAIFIDNILNGDISLFGNKENILIGQEIMYGVQKLFADIVLFTPQKMIAIEIKAFNDNFKRLDNQLQGYRKIFDNVYVLTTENHLTNLKSLPYKWFGILEITNDREIILKRKSKNIRKFNKEDILETIPIGYLCNYFDVKHNKLAIEIRSDLHRKTIKELKRVLAAYMEYKIGYKFKNFKNERGNASHYEDISILSMSQLTVLRQ